MRIYYAAGPGNILGTFDHWLAGEDDPCQVAITYSGQFFDACRRGGHAGYALGCPDLPPQRKTAEGITVELEPRPFRDAGRLGYHTGALRYHRRQIRKALDFDAELAVISPQEYLFPYLALKRRGVKLVATLHCVLWPKHRRPGPLGRQILRLEARALKQCDAVLCISRDIANQVRELCGDQTPPILEFLPAYRPGSIQLNSPPAHDQPVFRLLFAGRFETNKGVYLLLELARRLRERGGRRIRLDLCGEGSQLEAVRQQAKQHNLEDLFVLHGHLGREAMHEIYYQAHAVIVPTSTDFVEGFNKVVAEAVISGRPVVTSTVCPLDYVRDAAVEAQPDDIDSYQQAVLQLAEDPDLYDRKRRACVALREQFFDDANGWRATLERVVHALEAGQPIASRTIAGGAPG